jgi:hypothetical protein
LVLGTAPTPPVDVVGLVMPGDPAAAGAALGSGGLRHGWPPDPGSVADVVSGSVELLDERGDEVAR